MAEKKESIMGQEVDETFVQEIEHRADLTASEADGIPLIDLFPLLVNPIPDDVGGDLLPAISDILEEVEAASREWGFFQVINHGVPTELLEGIRSVAKQFFALSAEEKARVKRDEKHPLGYNDREFTKNVRDWKETFDLSANDQLVVPVSCESGEQRLLEIKNQWPENPPEFREVCKDYTKAVENLALRLLELISLSLKLPAKRLHSYFEDQTSIIRLLHYPPCPSPDLALGVGRHKDSGGLTVLLQDEVGGLQVKRKSDGQWVRVKPIPDSFIINVGAIIQVWSNDKYESVEHRVALNSDKDRYSVPYFLNPGYKTMVSPLEELTTEEDPAKYHEYNWGIFFRSRNTSTYTKQGEENVQISHFRKTE